MTKSILQGILAYLARATIRKYRPVIIGITGSVGKTSTREAVFAVLKKKYRVRTAEKNYNNEIGLPLTILGIPHYGKNILGWLYGLIRANRRIVWHASYPEVLVLEYGVDRPGDMDYLLSIARPDIAIVTAIGDIPVHVEFFEDPEELIKEKTKLVSSLPQDGYAILNHDDYAVYDMKEKTDAKVFTFGSEEHADLRLVNYQMLVTKDAKLGDIPEGINFKIEHGGKVIPIKLRGAFGMPHAYAASAAAATGLTMNMNFVEISQALEDYIPPAGRLRLLKGIKDSLILDDTYNAAPESMRAALDTLKALPGKRKIAVLGDMLEIGKYAEQAHRAIGDKAAEFVDVLFTVGLRAKFIADEYRLHRRPERHPDSHPERSEGSLGPSADASGRPTGSDSSQKLRMTISGRCEVFDDSVSAGRALDPLTREGDLILIKGSQSIRMEKAVFEVMRNPEEAHKLLVRQDRYWQSR